MKSVQSILSTVAVLATIAALSLISVYSAAQDKKASVPTRKELVTLLKTAEEPPEHRRIAAYYRHEAASLTQSAKEHSELAAIYQQKLSFRRNGVEAWRCIRSRSEPLRKVCSTCKRASQRSRSPGISARRHGQRSGEQQ